MDLLFLLLFLLAGVFFGLAAGRVQQKAEVWIALGLLSWTFVQIIKAFQQV